MLLNNEKHQKFHSVGPKDVKFGGKDDAVMMVSITRSTIDNEQLSVSVPVFAQDSREDMDLRIGMALSIAQERMEDANEAWKQVAATKEEESEE